MTVPGAARALSLFEIYAQEKRGLTKSEVARLMNLPESSTSDLLNTLHDLGYVSRTVSTRQYFPTGRLAAVATAIPVSTGMTTFGTEAASMLASRTGETACFAVLAGHRAEIVAVAQAQHRLRYVVTVGDTVSLHGTSIGKAILGGLPDGDRERLLRTATLTPLTPHTKVVAAELEAELRDSGQCGWYQAVDEGTVGVSSFAVSGRLGEHVVGLGVIGPSERLVTRTAGIIAEIVDVRRVIFERADRV